MPAKPVQDAKLSVALAVLEAIDDQDRLEVDLAAATCTKHGATHATKRRGLKALEDAELIRVAREKGRVPRVTVLDPISFGQLPWLLECDLIAKFAAHANTGLPMSSTSGAATIARVGSARHLLVENPIFTPPEGIVSAIDVAGILEFFGEPFDSDHRSKEADPWWSAFANNLGTRYGIFAPFELRPDHVMEVVIRTCRGTSDPTAVMKGVKKLTDWLDWCLSRGHMSRWQAYGLAYVLHQHEGMLVGLAGSQAAAG